MSLTDDFRRGDVLSHEVINELIRRTEPARPRASGGISVRTGPRGQVQVTGTTRMTFVGKANGSISAGSGSTWGTGSVTRWQFNYISGASSSTSLNYDAVNPAASAIASGQDVFVEEDDDGNLVVMPLGNAGYWCQLSSTLAAATGTWPNLTAGSLSGQTVYSSATGSLVSMGTFTVLNWYATSFASGKTTALRPTGGGDMEVIDQNC